MKVWHYVDAQREQHQIPEAHLKEAIQKGVIKSTTKVWSSGMSAWANASDALAPLFKTAETPEPAPKPAEKPQPAAKPEPAAKPQPAAATASPFGNPATSTGSASAFQSAFESDDDSPFSKPAPLAPDPGKTQSEPHHQKPAEPFSREEPAIQAEDSATAGPEPAASPSEAPASSPAPNQKAHEIDYELIGGDMQIVEIELDPGETVVAEAGAMSYLEQDIDFEAKMGDGSEPPNEGMMNKLLTAGKRAITGESLFMTHFTHRGASGKRKVAFAAPFPGQILAIDLAELGGQLTCQKDSFLCAAHGTKVTIAFNKKIGAGFFGGEGFILQKLCGDGKAFIHAGGTIVEKELKGETLRVDTGCLVGFGPGIDYDIQKAGNLKSMVLGGEGLFLASLSGTGKVWLQSLPFSRMAERIVGQVKPTKSRGEGSVLGALGNLFGD